MRTEWNMAWLVLTVVLINGCMYDKATGMSGKATQVMQQTSVSTENLSILSVTGGLCLIAGLALLTISRGARGWFPAIGGVILVVLNYMVAEYSQMLFYPLVVCTGMISAAWTYKTVKQILMEKQQQ